MITFTRRFCLSLRTTSLINKISPATFSRSFAHSSNFFSAFSTNSKESSSNVSQALSQTEKPSTDNFHNLSQPSTTPDLQSHTPSDTSTATAQSQTFSSPCTSPANTIKSSETPTGYQKPVAFENPKDSKDSTKELEKDTKAEENEIGSFIFPKQVIGVTQSNEKTENEDKGSKDGEYGFRYHGPEPTRYGDWAHKGRVSDF